MPSEAGTWSGPLNDQAVGTGAITLSLSQSDGTLTGTYTITGLSAADNQTGSVFGNLAVTSNTQAAMTLTPNDTNHCVLFANATVNGSQMTASYDSTTCVLGSVKTGTFVVNKQ